MRNSYQIPVSGQELKLKLAGALIQKYHARTDKKARYRPANPDKKKLGNPKIRKPTKEEDARIREIGYMAA